MMNTKELEEVVRDNLLEYNSDPFSAEYIVRKLNEAYRFAYNFFVKESDTHFGVEYPLPMVGGQSAYDLPENLWTKRIETLLVPAPPNMSQDPWNYVKVAKRDYKQTYRWQTSKIKTYFPEYWSQLNNKIYVFPPPIQGYTAKLIVSRALIPLAPLGGRIISLGTDTMTLDTTTVEGVEEFYDSRIETNANDPANGYLSVCDGTTGELKAIFPYTGATGTSGVITLGVIDANRTKYMNVDITTLPGSDWSTTNIELDDLVVWGKGTAVPILGAAFDTFLTDWATMKIRGSLNETDQEVMNSLKLQLKELSGDLGGRPMGVKIARTTANSWGVRPLRRT